MHGLWGFQVEVSSTWHQEQYFSSFVFLFFLLMRNEQRSGRGQTRQLLYAFPPASPLGFPHTASARCIYSIMPTPPDQLFLLAQVAPLSWLSLLIRVGVGVSVSVGPMCMYALHICRCVAHPCPGRNIDRPFSLQVLSPPPSFFVFGGGFCDMRAFCTRGYREAGPVEKKPGCKTLVPRTIDV